MSAIDAVLSGSLDAVAILTADHDEAKKQFNEFRFHHLRGEMAAAEEVARRICRHWMVHTTIEEEIFYPEARAALNNEQLVDEVNADRAMAKELMVQIAEGSMADDKYAARVGMLAEYVNHHVREEHEELFPQVRQSGLDLGEIGSRLIARRLDLEAEMAEDSALKRGAGGSAAGPRTARPN